MGAMAYPELLGIATLYPAYDMDVNSVKAA
ncbi:MAG: hypothetical protein ACJAWP_001041 [Porticoccus sp.]|jgi:hypothetical protein